MIRTYGHDARAVPLVWIALLSLGCSVDGGGRRVDGGDPVDAGDAGDANVVTDSGHAMPTDRIGFLTEYAAEVCAMYAPCCTNEELGYDASGCTEWFRDVTAAYWLGEYRAAEGMACLSQLAAARAADADRCTHVTDFDLATLRDTCSLAIASPVGVGAALGESCSLGSDCAGSEEAGTVICYDQACLLEQRGVAGDGPCFFGAGDGIDGPRTRIARCEATDGLYCNRTDNVCAPQVDDGELCPFSTACKQTALCTGGRCMTLPGPGEGCLNAVPGAGGYCRAGSRCDVPSLTCEEALENGASCSDDSQCASSDCDGTCQPPMSDFTRSLNCTG